MLLHQRRQELPSPHYRQPTYFDSVTFTSSTPSPVDITALQESQQRNYFDTRSADFTTLPLSPAAVPSMSGFDFSSNPAIRIQQSTPTPQSTYDASSSDSLANAPFAAVMGPQTWDPYAYRKNVAHHRRGPSSSSVASSPASPFHRTQFNTIKSEQSPVGTFLSADGRRAFPNLPTPSDTPTSDSFAPNGLPTASNSQGFDTMGAHYAMKEMLMGGQEVVPDTPEFSHSGRHSVSSYNDHEAPNTPRTVSGDEFDFRPSNQDTMKGQHTLVPKFDRSLSDIFQDELFNPAATTSMPNAPRNQSNASLLSPYSASRNLQERLQAANKARSTSPSSRDASPYRQASAFAQSVSSKFGNRYNPDTQLNNQPKPETDSSILETALAKQSQVEAPKSVSPKDTILEYRETEADAKMPLFPEEEANECETRYGGGDQQIGTNATSGNYNPQASAQSYTDMASDNSSSWTVPQHPSASSYSQNASMNLQPQASYNAFAQQSLQVPSGMHGIPFTTQHYRNANNLSAHEEQPEFPAHLTSMESSMSEAAPTSSQNSVVQEPPQQKPSSSLAETGTYSCTYHGCAHRFPTPQKLQKHKREAHRSVGSQTSTGIGSGMTSAQLLARNSQAGPHRCDRINPTTGKPCSTIFSRPYDLTRHEDTIHNARKQKVRCALCVEEKTFSRNDALTRHMRVVHPEVDFPGKHRRRGAGSE